MVDGGAQRLALGHRWHQRQRRGGIPFAPQELGNGVTTVVIASELGAMPPTWMQQRWNQALAQVGHTRVS